MEELESLLQSFLRAGQANNEEIQVITARFEELACTPAFYFDLFNIFEATTNNSIKQLAIILFKSFIKNQFLMDSIDPARYDIIGRFMEIASIPIPKLKNTMYNTAKTLALKLSQEELWPDAQSFLEQLFDHDLNTINLALVLSLGLIKGKAPISDYLITQIVNILQQPPNYETLSLVFKCLQKIWIHEEKEFILNYAGLFGLFLKVAQFSTNQIEENEFQVFSKNALKFIQIHFTNFHNTFTLEDMAGLYQFVINSLKLPVSYSSKLILLNLLFNLIEYNITPEGDVQYIMEEMLPDFFCLTKEEYDIIEDSPKQFINEIHRYSSDFEDIRSAGTSVLLQLIKKFPDSIRIVIQFTENVFEGYSKLETPTEADQCYLYGSALYLAAIANEISLENETLLLTLITSYLDMVDEEDPIGKSSFFCILHAPSTLTPTPKLVSACIDHITDELLVIQYYVAICLSNFISQSKDDLKGEIHDQLSPDFSDLISLYIDLSNEFQSTILTKGIISLMDLFPEEMVEFAFNVGVNLFDSLLDVENESNSIEASQLIQGLIQMISDDQLLAELFGKELEYMNNIKSENVFLVFTEVLKDTILRFNEFNPGIWEILPLYITRLQNTNGIGYSDFADIFCIIIYKDPEVSERNETQLLYAFIMQAMQSGIDIESWNELARIAFALIYKAGKDAEKVDFFGFQCVERIKMEEFCLTELGMTQLVNALLMDSAVQLSEHLGDEFGYILDYWFDHRLFPETIITGMHLFDVFMEEPEVQMQVFETMFAVVLVEVLSKSKGDMFDEEGMLESHINWFDIETTLINYYQFYVNVMNGMPAIASYIAEQCVEQPDDLEKFNSLPVIAQKFSNAKQAKLARIENMKVDVVVE